jgi:hypothetical protein
MPEDTGARQYKYWWRTTYGYQKCLTYNNGPTTVDDGDKRACELHLD